MSDLGVWNDIGLISMDLEDRCSVSSDGGWSAVAAGLDDSVNGDVILETPSARPSGLSEIASDDGIDFDSDHDVGWAGVEEDDLGEELGLDSLGPRASAAAGKGSGGGSQKRAGRPKGIRGDREYRSNMRRSLTEDSDKSKLAFDSISEQMQHVRSCKAKKAALRSSQVSSAVVRLGPDPASALAAMDGQVSLDVLVQQAAFRMLQSSNAEASERVDSQALASDSPWPPGPSGRQPLEGGQKTFSLDVFLNNLFSSKSAKHVVREQGQEDAENALKHIFTPYRGYASVAADAESFGLTDWKFAKTLIRSASALKILHSKMWSDFLQKVGRMLQLNHSGELFVLRFRFDETPTTIRVADLDTYSLPGAEPTQSKSTQAPKQLAKILQTEFSVALLLKSRMTDEHVLLSSGPMPTPLQVLDRQTARNMKQALEDTMHISGMEPIAGKFKSKVMLFCADEYAANDLAQFSLQACRKDWLRVATLCDIHKGSTCQGKVFDLTGPGISAIINLSLSMTAAGSVSKLQGMLKDILSSKFELRIGNPDLTEDAWQFKQQVLDLFLEVPDNFRVQTAEAVSSTSRLRYSQRLKQRHIIEHFLNDDFRDHERIIFWARAGQYQSEEAALKTFLRFVVPALIPCACPIFPRNRWFGADGALDYVGLWASVHGLLTPLVSAWTGKDLKPMPFPAQEPLALDDAEEGWDFDISKVAHAAASAMPTVDADEGDYDPGFADGVDGPLPLQAPEGRDGDGEQQPKADGDGEDKDDGWHAWRQKLKTSVADWILRKDGPLPETQVALMRQYMRPILSLMTRLLYISSKRWTRDQMVKQASGQPREFRVVLASEQTNAKLLLKETLALMGRPPIAVPQSEWRSDISTLCFAMLSRLVCSVFQMFVWRCERYPYTLFKYLLGRDVAVSIYNEKRCLQDEMTQHLATRFNSEDSFASKDCHAIVQALALLVETDIGAIERQHTLSRKIIQSRSSAKAVGLEMLGADWLVRNALQAKTDSCSYMFFDSYAMVMKLKRRVRKNAVPKKVKKKRGGGGRFRAFLSVTGKGVKATPESWAQAGADWRRLTDEEKAEFEDIGKFATEAHRRGFHAFGKRDRKKQIQQPILPLPSSSSQMPHGAASASANSGSADVESQSARVGQELVAMSQQLVSVSNPENLVLEKLRESGSLGVQIRKQNDQHREDARSTLSQYLKGELSSAPSHPCADDVPDVSGFCPEGSVSLPKPSTLPWVEWLPPSDAMAQALFFDLCSLLCYLAFFRF